MHNAHSSVKSKCTSDQCILHNMEFDDRPEPAKRLEHARKARGFKSPKEASTYFGWTYETYIQHEQGTRGIVRAAGKYAKAFKVGEGWLLTGEGRGPGDESPSSEDADRIVGKEAIVAFLDRIDGLEDEDRNIVLGIILRALSRNSAETAKNQSRDQAPPEIPRRVSQPTR